MEILGCSADPPKKQKKFCEKKKFMGREYMGISRVTYIIDENGFIEKVYEKVSVKSHAGDILNDFA